MNRIAYRGEVMANVASLTDTEIAARIRHAAEIDRAICRVLRRYRAKHEGNGAAEAAAATVQAWADVGMACIYAAGDRQEVSIFTRRVTV